MTLTSHLREPARKLILGFGWLRAAPWWAQCTMLWLMVLFGLTLVASLAGGTAEARSDLGEGFHPWLGLSPATIPGIWARWDSCYYLMLAARGYAELPHAMGFFPLYPMLMAGLTRVTGLSLAMSGMIIAQLSYLVAILFFYKLARQIRDDHAYAMRSVLYLVLFPSSFFFFAIYAESLALAFAIIGVYHVLATPPAYLRTGLALGIASMARPVGWLWDVVPMVEFIRRRDYRPAQLAALVGGLALSVAGIVLFVLYLHSLTDSFLAIPQAQAEWRRQWQYPWVTLWKSLRITVTGSNLSEGWFLYAINWLDLGATLTTLGLTLIAVWRSLHHRFSWSLSGSLVCGLTFLLSSQGLEQVPLWGMTRWVAALLPIFLILGDLGRYKVLHSVLVAGSGILLVSFTAWWASGRWIG